MFQYENPHQRLYLIHLGVGAWHDNLDLIFKSEIFQVIEGLLEARITKSQHPPLDTMKKFGGMKTEHAHVAEMADGPSGNGYPKGMGRIIDQCQFVTAGNVGPGLQVAWENK